MLCWCSVRRRPDGGVELLISKRVLQFVATRVFLCTMPTNILRKSNRSAPHSAVRGPAATVPRVIVLEIGRFKIRVALAATPTADRIWSALPLFSTAETWGDSIHFEIPVKSGRDRTARLNVLAGDICFWSEDDRVLLGWGPTPISLPTEIRLMAPCNIWGRALDDPSVLAAVTPGEQVALRGEA